MTKNFFSFLAPTLVLLALSGCGVTPAIAPDNTKNISDESSSSSSTSTELSLDVTKNGTPYIGSTLAGTTAPLINFAPEDYQKAQVDQKNILLIFCDTETVCQTEIQNAIAAFNQIDNSQLIGFNLQLNPQDPTTTSQKIADQYQVTTVPTKIIFDSQGKKLTQTTDTWSSEQYLEQLNNL